MSPVRRRSTDSYFSSSSCDNNPKHASNVEISPSNNNQVDLSLSSVEMSPIPNKDGEVKRREPHCSFMPEVSFDTDESTSEGGAVKESSRHIGISSPDVSPIQYT